MGGGGCDLGGGNVTVQCEIRDWGVVLQKHQVPTFRKVVFKFGRALMYKLHLI